MTTALPQVLQFSHDYHVQLKTNDSGLTELHVTPKAHKKPKYRTRYDLPFVLTSGCAEGRTRWFYAEPGRNYEERRARAKYYWEEFITFVRGDHKRRRAESIDFTIDILKHIFVWKEIDDESRFFAEHLAEALIAHLRVGLDEGKTDARLKADAEEVAA